jgi:hypothetical protein
MLNEMNAFFHEEKRSHFEGISSVFGKFWFGSSMNVIKKEV